MARLGRLLSVLGLVLCGATGLGLSAPPAPTPKKPIIGKETARAGAGAGEPAARPGRFQLLRFGRCIRSWKHPSLGLGCVPS